MRQIANRHKRPSRDGEQTGTTPYRTESNQPAFLDEVSLYRAANDPKFEIATNLQRRARELNPDAEGMAQFQAVFEKARQENHDPAKWMETSSLVTAQKQLREAFAHPLLRPAWNEDLRGALSDTRKLQAFGLSAPQAEEIRAYMGYDADGKPGDVQRFQKDGVLVTVSKNPATAFRLFQDATKATYHDLETAKKAGMSEFAWKLFHEARTAQEDGSIPASAQEKLDDAFSENEAQEKLRVWYQAETRRNKGVPPDDGMLKRKVGELTAAWLQGRALRVFIKPAAPLQAGSQPQP